MTKGFLYTQHVVFVLVVVVVVDVHGHWQLVITLFVGHCGCLLLVIAVVVAAVIAVIAVIAAVVVFVVAVAAAVVAAAVVAKGFLYTQLLFVVGHFLQKSGKLCCQ